ncbi:V-type ATPase subunit [Saccharolobus caldissimus]|uniref:Uncharacterized protein n=1 Tax=Saccharolobus caldissimus TaxID=1702097 RepID=A0AAQ4CSF1_9CREN|nr:V-type ATPase subunit [Saccharolobus caldissimus]BDB98732.1 hypothetical protein SACC_17490 [Saccharolobus caldissimus]
MILTLPVSEFLYSVSKTLGPYIFDVNVDSYDDLVSLLSQKGVIRGKIENEEILEREVRRFYISLIKKLTDYSLVWKSYHKIANLIYYYASIEDFEYIISCIKNGIKINRNLIVNNELQKLSDVSSIQELKDSLKGTVFSEALDFSQSASSIEELRTNLHLYFIYKIKKFKSNILNKILCPYYDYIALIYALRYRKALDIACKFTKQQLEDLIEDVSQKNVNELAEIKSNALRKIKNDVKYLFEIQGPQSPLSFISALILLTMTMMEITNKIYELKLRKRVIL